MDALPVELLRLVFASCDPSSVKNLRCAGRVFADVGYEYLLPARFTALAQRLDVERLHCIAHHTRLRGSIETVVVNLSEFEDYSAGNAVSSQRSAAPSSAGHASRQTALSRASPSHLYQKADQLKEALAALPNLKEIEVTFTQCPTENEAAKEAYRTSRCLKMNRPLACQNLDAIIAAVHGLRLESFSVDRFPLEILKLPQSRRHWFANAASFDSLARLNLTFDPSGLAGPKSHFMAINGIGKLLCLSSNVRWLKLAFHPYTSVDSKFMLNFGDMLPGFVFPHLTELALEGVSCEEKDLGTFLAQHGSTLERLRLGGRGLATPYQVSLGGIHLSKGSFKSLFTGLHLKLPKLERVHLEGVFECDHYGQPPRESYSFYPLTNEAWEPIERPLWVQAERKNINCLPFEQYIKCGGAYPTRTVMAQQAAT